ncbi:glycosyltransferase, partial [bacterium]
MFGAPPSFRIVLIGNYAPEQCGLATFTTDLAESFERNIPDAVVKVIAMRETELDITSDEHLLYEVRRGHLADYVEAANSINDFGADIVCVQHEYGIFGGKSGEHLLTILRNVRAPIVTTLHTILVKPTEDQRRVLDEILSLSERVVTMSERGRDILHEVHGTHAGKIDMIPHGIPARPDHTDAEIKAELGFADHQVLLTFGLLSPDKGIENVVRALPAVVAENPDLLYVVVGATHPNIRRQHGEAYRESLLATAAELGVADHIRFVDAFVDLDELVRYICACDVYVTPYLKREQITSGTLAYAMGLGRPVVSTPYWYAEELLGDGRGLLVPARDPEAMSEALLRVFGDADLRRDLREQGLRAGKSMSWPAVAKAYNTIFTQSIEQSKTRISSIMHPNPVHTSPLSLPPLRYGHLRRLCDDTGLFQHAKYAIPNRAEGYCIDDNARMLILAVNENLDDLATLATTFTEYGFSADRGLFRNFMAYDRRWLETVGSDDSNGRTIWALATALNHSNDSSVREIARELLEPALRELPDFEHLRTHAFVALGVAQMPDARSEPILRRIATRLKRDFARNSDENWIWFEDFLSYDNARLCEAAIRTGVALEDEELIDLGFKTLAWLGEVQTDRRGMFAPVGCNGFYFKGGERAWFDQQPLEAAATVAALLAANEVRPDLKLVQQAENAFAWFLGRNAVGAPLADVATGGCCDGILPS